MSGERALVVGEALVDVVAGVAHPGGSPLNVAVGLSRLGMSTTLHTRIGADEFGVLVQRHAEASGVRLTPDSVDARPTSVAAARIGADGAAEYEFAIDGDLARPSIPLDRFDVVHTGSIAAALDPGASCIEELLAVARAYATISFDPNVRPQLMGDNIAARARIARFVAAADVVKASDEDLAWLYPEATIEQVAKGWLASGSAVVAVTRGSEGSTILCAAGRLTVPAPDVRLVDTIGAGDSYMAGLIAALGDAGLLGADRREALRSISLPDIEAAARFAASCAAITVSRPGADPPNRTEAGG
jgi:fructokinase